MPQCHSEPHNNQADMNVGLIGLKRFLVVSQVIFFFDTRRKRLGLDRWLGAILVQQQGPQLLLDFIRNRQILLQELHGIGLALANLLALVGIPGTRLIDQLALNPQIDQLTLLGDTGTVHDLEISLLEGWRHLVLDYFDSGPVAKN